MSNRDLEPLGAPEQFWPRDDVVTSRHATATHGAPRTGRAALSRSASTAAPPGSQ
ncbi:hypothetical protein ACNTMW_09450 [Planosporangium sp. 12N6]|uniref:hypothetical protein n=1 Tax=Planosporangium spinosum TaxID=3402278 RepID=UPI003CF1CC0E